MPLIACPAGAPRALWKALVNPAIKGDSAPLKTPYAVDFGYGRQRTRQQGSPSDLFCSLVMHSPNSWQECSKEKNLSINFELQYYLNIIHRQIPCNELRACVVSCNL